MCVIKRNYLRSSDRSINCPFLFHPDSDPIIRKGTDKAARRRLRSRGWTRNFHKSLPGFGAPNPISTWLSVTTLNRGAHPKMRDFLWGQRPLGPLCDHSIHLSVAPFSPQSIDNLEPSCAPVAVGRSVGLSNDHLFPVLVSRCLQLQRAANSNERLEESGGASERQRL